MTQFHYRLQSVLNVREQLEDDAKNKLAGQVRKLNEEEKRLKTIHGEKDKCFANIVKMSGEGVNVAKLCQYNHYLSSINGRLDQQVQSVNQATQNVDIHREKLIEAAKDKKILETLKEKELQTFLQEQLKKEEKRIDEVLSYKYTVK